MSLQIETKEAIAAMQAAAKECDDVVAAAANPDELGNDLEGTGYSYIVQRITDARNILNNVLKDVGGVPVVPAAPAPRVEVREAEPVVEQVTRIEEVDRQSTLDKLEALEADNARLRNLVDQGVQEIETVMAENQTLKAEEAGAPDEVTEALKEVKKKIDEREVPFSFSVAFLDEEAQEGEDHAATNARLLADYEELQQTKQALNFNEDQRRERLRAAFYSFRG